MEYHTNLGGLPKSYCAAQQMTTKNVSLTHHYAGLADSILASGKYKTGDELIGGQ